jgi:superkiller protein 3
MIVKRALILITFLLAGAVLFQSFQCSSRNITTAKVKMKNQLLDEAIESLNKELEVNPNSDEALALMADIYFQKKDKKESARYAKKVIEISKDPVLIEQERKLLNNLWIECYNSGMNYYSSYLSNKNPAILDSAINEFKLGTEVIPDFIEFYNLLGIIYELKGNSELATQSYIDYVNKSEKNYQFAAQKGLYSKISREKAHDLLGKPKIPTPGLNSKGDSTFIDYYEIDGKELYLFSESINSKIIVTGWNYDMPKDWLPNEKRIRTDINTNPLTILAQQYYEKKDLDNALKYIKKIISLEPDNTVAYSSMIGIYQELGKTDEAIKTVQDLIKADPKNVIFKTQLADLYQNFNRYDESIKIYLEVLDIDPNYERASRNLASAFKNRASVKQKAEQDKVLKDKSYKINLEMYLPDLRESAKYFAKALESKTFANDMLILSELSNIYQVLDEKESLKKTVRSLEAIEFSIKPENLEDYYLRMLKIYSEMQDDKKTKEIATKLENMKK